MIEFRSYSLGYGRRILFENANIVANNGEITALVGHNGSGKTSLISSIFSTRGATIGGNILIDGIPRENLSSRELARRVALMPQTLPVPSMSVRELVELGRAPYTGTFGRLSPTDKEMVEAAILNMRISHLCDKSVESLSGGERQAAYLAMTLAKDARNILLDEPAASLDMPSRVHLYSFVRALRAEGRSVFMIMHDLSDCAALADKIFVLDATAVSSPMTPEEFRKSRYPQEVFASGAYDIETEEGSRVVYRPMY